MKIGLIAPPWIAVPPMSYGGTEVVLDNLARGLADRGHDVILFTVGTSTSPVSKQFLFPEPIEPLGQTVPEAAHVLAAYEALSDVDVIHDHTILGPLLSGRTGRTTPPVVTTNHGPFTATTRRVYREIARTAAVVAISADQAQRAADVPIAAVIHHGIDLETYQPGPGNGDHLVFIGRMSPDKGVHSAVRIARAAGKSLRIISKMREQAEIDYFEACVRPLLSSEDEAPMYEAELRDRVRILGTAAGLVNPIAWPEPFGLVMAESLAVGTPVIASPLGAAPEIVTHGRTGFLCSTDASATRAVAHLTEIDRAACREDAERRFSLAGMATDYERLYESVTEESVTLPRQRKRDTQTLQSLATATE